VPEPASTSVTGPESTGGVLESSGVVPESPGGGVPVSTAGPPSRAPPESTRAVPESVDAGGVSSPPQPTDNAVIKTSEARVRAYMEASAA